MNTPTTYTGAQRSRALALGATVTVSLGLVSALLLQWSWTQWAAAAGADAVPVSTGLAMLFAAGAGLTSAAVAWLAGLGVFTLAAGGVEVRGPTSPDLRVASRWGVRVSAALLALSLGAPSAQAAPSPASSATSLSLAIIVTADSPFTSGSPSTSDSEHHSDSPRQPNFALPGWSPTAPNVPTPNVPEAKPHPQTQPSTGFTRPEPTRGLVVTRGDTLWDIAASSLQPGATDAEIAVHWPRWYEANRSVIGPDPNLLRPGQILQPPPIPGVQP